MNRSKLALIIIALGIILTASFTYSTGKFERLSITELNKTVFQPDETYYFGQDMKWNGLASPSISKINIIQSGSTANKDNRQDFSITPFIDYARHTGTLNENMYQEMLSQNKVDYKGVNGDKLESDEFSLVFRVKTSNESLKYDIKGFEIYYKVLGIPKKQFFEYNAFFAD